MQTSSRQVPFYRHRVFQITVSLLLLAALASRIEWTSIARSLRSANVGLLALLLVIMPLDRVFMAWKWRLLALAQGGSISLRESIRIYLLSNLTGAVLPLGGVGPDLVRVTLLNDHGMPTAISVPSIMVERLVGLLAALMMVATGLLIGMTLLGSRHFPLDRSTSFGIVALIVLVLVTSIFVMICKGPALAGASAPALLKRMGLVRHWEVLSGFAGHRRLLALSLVLSWVEQWCGVLIFYITCAAFDVPLGFLACSAIIPVASMLERLPISVAGLGVKEVGIVYMAKLFGVPLTQAFLVSVTSRLFYLFSLFIFNLVGLMIRPSNKFNAQTP